VKIPLIPSRSEIYRLQCQVDALTKRVAALELALKGEKEKAKWDAFGEALRDLKGGK